MADAIVNDQLQNDVAELCERAGCDVIGQRVSFRTVHCILHHGRRVVAAHADGNVDKRGLSDPMEILIYFTLAEERIVQIAVLRDCLGTAAFDGSSRRLP